MLSFLCRALVCSKTVLNSTPTKIAPFITFLHSIFGLYSAFSSFRECLQKGLECAISGDRSSPCGGKPHCWFTDKTVSGMHVLQNNTFLVWEHCEVCAFLTSPCLLYSRYSTTKYNEAENPWLRDASHQESGWGDIKTRTQKSTTVRIQELKSHSYLPSKNFSNNV